MRVNPKIKGTAIEIHLLSDTIVLSKPRVEPGCLPLLYPPMPLSHVDIVHHVEAQGKNLAFDQF